MMVRKLLFITFCASIFCVLGLTLSQSKSSAPSTGPVNDAVSATQHAIKKLDEIGFLSNEKKFLINASRDDAGEWYFHVQLLPHIIHNDIGIIVFPDGRSIAR